MKRTTTWHWLPVILLVSRAASATTPPATALLDDIDKKSASAAAARDKVAAASKALADLIAQRAKLKTALATEQRALRQHEATAAAAFKRYQSAKAKDKVTPADAAQLAKARTEYGLAVESGARLDTDTRALRALEERISKQLDANQRLAEAAKAAADDALGSLVKLKSLAKTSSDGSQVAAKNAGAAAKPLLATAQLPSHDYDAYQNKVAKADAALAQRVAAVKAALNHKSSPALKQCDIRNVDWKNYPYGEFPPLTDGAASIPEPEGSTEWGVGSVEFFDLDGDGSAEALVSGEFAYLGATASQRPYLFVLSAPHTCQAEEVGAIEGQGMCANIERQGRKLVLDNCGETVEYQLIQGKLKVTKGHPW